MTLVVVAVIGAIALGFFVWFHVETRQRDGFSAGASEGQRRREPRFECDPATCEHEWEYWDNEYETTIGNSSYGGCDPMGIVTEHHSYCPKCGAHEVTESVRELSTASGDGSQDLW